MPRKIDPLNKKLYGSVTAMLTVTDVKAAADFYQKAFGFAKRGIMNGPDGKAIHAELTLRGTTRSEEHTSELQSPVHLVCRLLLEKKKPKYFLILVVTAANTQPH